MDARHKAEHDELLLSSIYFEEIFYSGNATSAITGRWSEYARALQSVQAERIVKSREA